MRHTITVLLFTIVYASTAQVEWEKIPWTVIGDSSQFNKNEKVILTGSVSTLNGEKVSGASLSLDLLKYFDYTDSNGKYLLEIPAGKYKLTVRHVGMIPQHFRLKVYSTGLFNITVTEGIIDLEAIVISSRAKDANISETISGVSKLSIDELKLMPALLGEVDILKSIQALPGVTSVGEGSSAFNVRGGRADQNLVLINGAPIFNSSHALGFVTGLNQDAIKGFTFYKGNVPSNFGGRASSVLDISLKPGNFEKWNYNAGIGLVSSRLSADGPIIKDKTTLLIGGRISNANWLLRSVKDPSVKQSSVFFYDANAFLTHKINDNSSINLTLYSSHDFFRYTNQFGFAWQNYLAHFDLRTRANKKASPLLSLTYGKYDTKLIDPSGFDESQIKNSLNYIKLKESVNYQYNDNHSIIAGIEATAYLPQPEKRAPYKTPNTVNRKQVDRSHGIESALFIQDDFDILSWLSASIGLRFSHFQHIGQDTVFVYQNGLPKSTATIEDTLYYKKLKNISSFSGFEPRLSFRVKLDENQSIKFSYNRMLQYIHLISNTASPTPVDVWQVSNNFMRPQTADNYSVGYFINLNDNMYELSAEVFYKSMTNLLEYKNFAKLLLNNHLETEVLPGIGRSYGLEFYANKRKGYWTGWISYTYSQTHVQVNSPFPTESINRGNWYAATYNKPHNFNILINRRLSKGASFSIMSAFNTGRPITAIETSYIADGIVVPVYSDRNKYKIPNYFRMDFSLTIGNLFKKVDDSLVFSIYNIFSRENPYSVFYKRPSDNYLIPTAYKLSVLGTALPSLTYNIQF